MWFDTLVLQLRLHMAYRVNGILYRLRFLSLSYESGFAKTLGLVLAILRELLGLRSSDFDFALQDGTFTFTPLGYGHGVGLSQYGADYLARQGSDYRAILEHYYTGASVVEREE